MENAHYFTEMADAMNQVADLPRDASFIDFIRDNQVVHTVRYQQGDEGQPFCLDTSMMQTFKRTEPGQHIINVSELALDSTTSDNTTTITGTAQINQTDYLIEYTSDEGVAHFREREHLEMPPSFSLSEPQIKELLFSCITGQQENFDVEDTLDLYNSLRSEADKLPALIFALGNIKGSSSQETTALIESDDTDMLAVRLTEETSPHSTTATDTLSVFSANEFFTDTSYLVKKTHGSVDDNSSHDDAEYTLRGQEHADASHTSLAFTIGNPDASTLNRYDASGDQDAAREYAHVCIQFLAAYKKARAKDTAA